MEEDMDVAMFFVDACNEEKKVSHENNEIISKDQLTSDLNALVNLTECRKK